MEIIIAGRQPRSSTAHQNVYSSTKEMKQESIFLIFVFLWVWPPRVGRIGSRVEGEGGGRAGPVEEGTKAGPQGALLSRQGDEGKRGRQHAPLRHSLRLRLLPFPKTG